MTIHEKLRKHPEVKQYLSSYFNPNEEWEERYPGANYLYEECHKIILELYSDGKIKLNDFENKLYEAIQLINDVVMALTFSSNHFINKHKRKKREKALGYSNGKKMFYSFEYLNSIHGEDIEINNINITSLNDCILEYLKMDWFKSKEIEFLLADAYIRYCLKVNRESFFRLKFGLIIGSIFFFGAHNEDSYSIRAYILAIIKIFLGCAFLRHTYHLILQDNLKLAFSCIVMILSYVGYKIAIFPSKREAKKIVDLLFSAHKLLHSTVWEPTKLLSIAEEIEKFNIQTPELVPLIKKICGQPVSIF